MLMNLFQDGNKIKLTGPKFQTLSTTRLLEDTVGWLVGCFGFNGPLRQYFSLYRAVSQREGEEKRIDR